MIEEAKIRSEIASKLSKPAGRVADATPLLELVQESFALVELVIDLQETFGVRFSQEDLNAVRTVGDLVALVRKRAP